MDGKWYHLDTTWDDPLPDVKGRTTYTYYNLTDEQMRKQKHTWTREYPSASSSYFDDLKKKIADDPAHAQQYYSFAEAIGYDYPSEPVFSTVSLNTASSNQVIPAKQSDSTKVASYSAIFTLWVSPLFSD